MNENVQYLVFGVVRKPTARTPARIVALFSTYTEAEKSQKYLGDQYTVEEVPVNKKYIQP